MKYLNKLYVLESNLRKLPKATHHNELNEQESNTLAHALLDIEESCRALVTGLLPKLMDQSIESTTVGEVLLDIGEELRHILYHIKDSAFYKYLVD